MYRSILWFEDSVFKSFRHVISLSSLTFDCFGKTIQDKTRQCLFLVSKTYNHKRRLDETFNRIFYFIRRVKNLITRINREYVLFHISNFFDEFNFCDANENDSHFLL